MENEYKYDVFISYSRHDYFDDDTKEVIPNNVISIIKETLKKNDISYWMDEEGNLTGKKFAHIIAGKIRESIVFLFVCSKNSVASKWVDRELSVADTLDKHIIPFICDDSYKDDNVIMFTSSLDRVEYHLNPKKELEKLVKAVKKDKEEFEERKRKEEERLKKEIQEEEERKRRLEEERQRKQAEEEIKQIATNFRLHTAQQDVILQQLYEKNVSIGNEKKTCPVCGKEDAIRAGFCSRCGFQFPKLYSVDGNATYPFDEFQISTAKAIWIGHDSIEKLRTSEQKLSKENQELKESYERISEECKRQLEALEKDKLDFEQKRKEAEHRLSIQLQESKEKVLALKKERDALHVNILSLKKELATTTKKAQNAQDELYDCRNNIQQLEENYHTALEKLEESRTRIKDLEHEIANSKDTEQNISFNSRTRKKKIKSSNDVSRILIECKKREYYLDLFPDDSVIKTIDAATLQNVLKDEYGINISLASILSCENISILKSLILSKADIS